ncbi:MAG TPA: type I DNA topoisomerase [Bacillota bacterium]|jgi:DNA topoisomerase-1|nr:type I DNA topoisomerase [Bacillota bacterium]HOL10160.1 type I DNA topoisomerase [Bacillota bacterium]HPO97905.1 type I DNA topoisomerase [Bacillota bacterium]
MKSLVIVESPAKAKTIEKYLGKKFTVKASMGHLVDLPKSQFGVDIKDGFKPKYINIRGKGKIIKELKEAATKAEAIYLATDPDREGEAISWHLANTLGVEGKPIQRIEFHEITKKAVEESLKKPRAIDMDRVNAQQTRRILDRIVGYELSPLLWKKVRRGLSAGRVQSVAVRLVCEREQEINEFIPEEYWSIEGIFTTNKKESFSAKLHSKSNKKIEIKDEAQAKKLEQELKKADYTVSQIKHKEKTRYPAPPFTTSSLQQEAARKLNFGARKTMMLAQQLYEGIDLGDAGSDGLITYMRTDSVRVAEEAQVAAREEIKKRFGIDYLPKQAPVYKTKTAGAQEAHEAIRPTNVARHPSTVKPFLSRDQYRLYQLIWDRFIASQMNPAIISTVAVDITTGSYLFRATGSTVKFAGFLEVYQEGKDEEETETEGQLPELIEGEKVTAKKLNLKQHFTQPPPRYTEASLIKTLEEKGIGRPSTYAPTIDTIIKRNYVQVEEKRLRPTELGQVVVDLLKKEFSQIIDYDFTAEMEEQLDKIAEGDLDWVKVLEEFYAPFSKELQKATKNIEKVELAPEESDQVCDKCGRKMIYKYGRFGKFLACPGYPECKNTKPLRKELDLKCPKCGEGTIVERKSKKGRMFYGCNRYPGCDFASWERPYKEPCPKCGSMSVAKGEKITCLNEKCGYSYEKEPVAT